MPLAPDQQAMFQLLLERDQSYADLGAVLGVEEAEVRERSRRALAELGGADPDRKVGLTDYLLGQADPIGRADAVRHLKEDPEDHQLAASLVERLRELAPGGRVPKLPAAPHARRGRRSARTVPGAATADTTRAPDQGGTRTAGRHGWRQRLPHLPAAPRLSRRGSQLAAAGATALVILVAVVFGVSDIFGGDGDSASTASTTSTTPAEEPTAIPLQPLRGGDARGNAVLGYANADQPFLDLAVRGAPPAKGDEVYILWFLLDEQTGFPIPARIPIDRKGEFSNRLSLPAGVLPFIDQAQFLDLSLVDARTLDKEITRALDSRQGAVRYIGQSVLRGEVPGSASAG